MNIVVDSSAFVAILLREEGFELYSDCISTPGHHLSVPAPAFLETLFVLTGRKVDAESAMRRLLRGRSHSIVPFDEAMALAAHQAFLRYGKGRHPAALNFGDCMAYAAAKALDAPLLFKGDDFSKTDVIAAL